MSYVCAMRACVIFTVYLLYANTLSCVDLNKLYTNTGLYQHIVFASLFVS